jgi:hypothetical protein
VSDFQIPVNRVGRMTIRAEELKPGDRFEFHGPCVVISNTPSGYELRRIQYRNPNTVNPPGVDYRRNDFLVEINARAVA